MFQREKRDFHLDITGQNGDRHREVLLHLHLGVVRLRLRLKSATMVFRGTREAEVLRRNVRSLMGRR